MIEFGNEGHGHEIMESCHSRFAPQLHTVISRSVGGVLLGGVVFTDHNERSCQMHQWGRTKHWGCPDMLWVCFHYPLVQLGYDCVLGTVREGDGSTYRINLKYGFVEVARIKSACPSGALIIMQMMKEDCRWLSLKPRHIQYGGV
jgi:hypothetical protein